MKRSVLGVCLALLVLLMSGCQFIPTQEEEATSYTYTSEADYDTLRWDPVTLKVEKSYLSAEDRDYTAAQVESAVQAAKSYLNGTELKPVELILHNGSGATMVYEGRADVYYAQNRDIPYTSLITQVMAGVEGVPEWLREGVGAYVADINHESLLKTQGHMIESLNRYVEQQKEAAAEQASSGEPAEEPYYPIEELAGVLYRNSDYTEALELGDMANTIASIGYAQEAYNYRGAYCIYAGSFVKYLEKTYGHDPVIQVYQGEAFDEVFGLSFEEAREAWIAQLG